MSGWMLTTRTTRNRWRFAGYADDITWNTTERHGDARECVRRTAEVVLTVTDHLEVIARLTSVIEGQHAAPPPADYRGLGWSLIAGLTPPYAAAYFLGHDGLLPLAATALLTATGLGFFLVWTILPRKA